MNRRDFIKTAALTAAGCLLLSRFSLAADETSAALTGKADVGVSSMPLRKFGKTGVSVSPLGFGMMRLPTTDGKINQGEVERMLKYAIEHGLNYIDTAYVYHKGESEVATGLALKKSGYRDKVNIATKYPFWGAKNPSHFDKVLDEQLKRLQTDHIDMYLLHSLNAGIWKNQAVPWKIMDKLEAARKAGKIRFLGFSIHDSFDAFKEIVDDYGKWDFCQIQLNYLDENYQAGLRGVKYAAEKGMGVVIMEPLRGGQLASNLPTAVSAVFSEAPKQKTPVEWALDYLWNMPEISIALSGMGEMQHVQDNILYAERSSVGMLSKEDLAVVEKAHQAFLGKNAVPCTSCGYCLPCPVGIPIPSFFTALNTVGNRGKERGQRQYDGEAKKAGVRASDCITCRKCEDKCPQHIKIADKMKEVAAAFDTAAKK